ncbi:sensor histidine kinase [Streptomyces anthocyanicus]|uniref:hypothetical protein n=1 Tax=Streptomyces anthocyanicus TaxID=68174 RepID=UPI003810FBE9
MKELMLNAAQHVGVGRVTLVLTVLEDQDLLIQVKDEDPHFEEFAEATAAERCSGLGLIQALGGAITWRLLDEGGKAVQVRLPASSSCAVPGDR